MKIVRLSAENIKKLRAVEITPSGEVVTIAGRNGQGKTSIMDSIWWALAGTANVQSQPIRKGADKAHIKLDLGRIVVERHFTAKGSTLTVENAEGARYSSPQALLDKIIGELSFDPLSFARMDPKHQVAELKRVAKVDIDLDQLAGLNRGDYERRTEINRDAKAKRAQANGVVVPPKPDSDAIDESKLVDALEEAGRTNADIQARRQSRDSAVERRDRILADSKKAGERAAKMRVDARADYDAAIKRADEALRKAQKDADAIDSDAKTGVAEAERIEKTLADAPPLPEAIDVTALRQKIDAARATNKAIEEHAQAQAKRDTYAAAAHDLEMRSLALTEQIDAREKAAKDAIAAAQMPVPGLGFGDGVVTFNGLPFDQCSSAEQLRVSMGIAMAANPKLRVIRITDGSLLDDDSMAAIAAMAKDGDFQVWVEKVDGSGRVGIVIEDGAVASTPESRAAAPDEPALQGHTA